MMKCLIPVHQEAYPKNSLNRAEKICDTIVLLYIIDRKLIEKVVSETSYILPSYALDNVEEFIINIHRQEAEKIRNSIKNVPMDLKFVVGEYYKSVEIEIIKSSPNMIMCDFYQRGFLNMDIPIWIDKGGKIKDCTIVIYSLKKVKKIKYGIEFAKKICERLDSSLFIHYPYKDNEGLKALKPMGKMIDLPKGELLIFLKEQLQKIPQDISLLLI